MRQESDYSISGEQISACSLMVDSLYMHLLQKLAKIRATLRQEVKLEIDMPLAYCHLAY